MIYIKTKLLPT